ncbi:hypothetical protein AVEN_248267-1 [Araneus ventricosus]|uniref:Ig-like domain-containing protein n=1 Tax=Araneus ventricosus TaxID=182803 RepID=A0A4Y2J0J5_ARAVE|nr:hypothetical protein AVEN_248267-1 [Araneus ventricosus]
MDCVHDSDRKRQKPTPKECNFEGEPAECTFHHDRLPQCGYLVLDGGRAELPCDVNVTTVEDDVTLILWHREDSGSPLYSVDARETTLPSAKHFPSINMSSRAYFNASGSPSVLRIDGVKKSEEGLYRCRVEYRRSRTETTDVLLTVIVPPKEAIIMDEYGQHLRGVIGPYNEGFPLGLACEGEGGQLFFISFILFGIYL